MHISKILKTPVFGLPLSKSPAKDAIIETALISTSVYLAAGRTLKFITSK